MPRYILLLSLPLLAQSWSPQLSLDVQSVAAVQPSPDGKLVAYTQTTHIVEAERSEQRTHLWVSTPSNPRPRRLTSGEKSVSSPAFSPDSQTIYYLSNQTIFQIPAAGGQPTPLTASWSGKISRISPSPDGKWLAFSAAPTDPQIARRARQKTDFRVIGEDPENHSLWLLPLPSGTPTRLTQTHTASFHWAPDSQSIAFEHWPAPGADLWIHSDISEVNISTRAVRPLAASPASESTPFYSPDGRYIAFVQTPPKARWPGDARIAILHRKTNQSRLLAATPDERPSLLGWNRASSALYFAEMKRTRSALYALPLSGAPPTLVYEPAEGTFFAGYDPNANLGANGASLGFARESSNTPPEAFVMTLPSGTPTQISLANRPLPPTGQTRAITWKSKDGHPIEGLLTLPPDYQPGTRLPLILNIHGGPANYFSETYLGKAGIYPLAVFASRGFAILRPNPRGSGGYGKPFRHANVNDWGGKDYADILSGVDHLIATGVADPNRMAVMGWSYGGFMTSWVITHTHRFKAAVVGAAVTNLWSFTGTADIPGFLPDYFQAEPWENFETYRAHSPMTYVKGVTTPTLILHGETDDRVPVTQGYELYNALKRQRVNVKMVVYPRTPHGPREPKFLLDIMQRHLDWVAAYVR